MTRKTSTKSLKTSTNIQTFHIYSNFHKFTKNVLKIPTKPAQRDVKLPLLFFLILQVMDGWKDESPRRTRQPNNGDEPPQEPEGKVWVSFTCTLRGGSNMADISAESWWWSIHPQSISDKGEVRCLLRAQRILKRLTEPEGTADKASVLRLWDSWTSSTK